MRRQAALDQLFLHGVELENRFAVAGPVIQAFGSGLGDPRCQVEFNQTIDDILPAVRRFVLDMALTFGFLEVVFGISISFVVFPTSKAALEGFDFVALLFPLDQDLIEQFLLGFGEHEWRLRRDNLRRGLLRFGRVLAVGHPRRLYALGDFVVGAAGARRPPTLSGALFAAGCTSERAGRAGLCLRCLRGRPGFRLTACSGNTPRDHC